METGHPSTRVVETGLINGRAPPRPNGEIDAVAGLGERREKQRKGRAHFVPSIRSAAYAPHSLRLE